jgi:hypothetical protein
LKPTRKGLACGDPLSNLPLTYFISLEVVVRDINDMNSEAITKISHCISVHTGLDSMHIISISSKKNTKQNMSSTMETSKIVKLVGHGIGYLFVIQYMISIPCATNLWDMNHEWWHDKKNAPTKNSIKIA